MSELRIERRLGAPPDKVYEFVTRPEHLVKWWGPEGMTIPEGDLDFTRKGNWWSVMANGEGGRYKVSGEVLVIDPPKALEFTWAWHDDADTRGHESRVRFEVHGENGSGTLFKVIHTGLADEESAANHKGGWNSSLNKLELLSG